jgi:type I restriction enzyme, R subunit
LGGVRRVLFLVDRANLGRQALKEFQAFRTPDDGRIFTELYNVHRLQSNRIDPVANPAIPIETFDIIVTDECHRSIYNLWRQVREYFDASLIASRRRPRSRPWVSSTRT